MHIIIRISFTMSIEQQAGLLLIYKWLLMLAVPFFLPVLFPFGNQKRTNDGNFVHDSPTSR